MTNKSSKRWLLPDGVQETLPPDALAVESLRHRILDLFHRWGYDLVMPALIEYRDSLLTGTAHALDTRTFALVDQLSGKQMGVRSDMTPQVARIDAHLLRDDMRHHRVSRLCYCGHLLHAIGDGINSSRTPIQIGAEIFGADSISADVEVASLMVATLHAVGLQDISLDLGHVGAIGIAQGQLGRSLHVLKGFDRTLDGDSGMRFFKFAMQGFDDFVFLIARPDIPYLQGDLFRLGHFGWFFSRCGGFLRFGRRLRSRRGHWDDAADRDYRQ